MNQLTKIVLALLVILLLFLAIIYIGGNVLNIDRFKTGENPVLRFVFVIIGLLAVFAIYYATRGSGIWEVGTREVVYMAIGAALFAIISYIFNGSTIFVPSVSQVSLRPAIALPIFFGYAFGPVVGFFTGAVGNMFGDALSGFGLSPQWSIGNGLVGLIAGLALLFRDRKRSIDTVLVVSAVLALLSVVIYLFNRTVPNALYFNPAENVFGDQPITIFAGIAIVIGFILVVAARFLFRDNVDVAAAVTWGLLGILIGLGFAAISDIWINGYSPAVAIVGEFLPAAGPDLIFAAILVPLLVLAYAAVRRQAGR